MVARLPRSPTQSTPSQARDGAAIPVAPLDRRAFSQKDRDVSQLAGEDPHHFARQLLDLLGRGDHPDAETNPIYALYQVAVDYRCSANGYRALALNDRDP